MTNEKNNLALWDRVCVTDPTYTKEVSFGRKFTSIDPQYQIKTATEVWGTYGGEWGIKDVKYEVIRVGQNNPISTSIDGLFFYPGGEFPISSEILFYEGKNNSIVKDQRKKLLTDITTKALSKLGFNADVFLGKFEDVKYMSELNLDHSLNKKVFNKAALKEYKEHIRTYLKAHDTMEEVVKKIEGKFERIESKTKAIMLTLTLENLDETILKL